MKVLLIVLATMAFALTAQAEKFEAKGKPKVYKGSDGQKVTFVRLKKPKADHALVMFQGTDSDFDNMVFMTKHIVNGDNQKFQIEHRGKTWNVLRADKKWSRPTWTAYVPGKKNSKVDLWFDEKSTEKAFDGTLFTAYKKHKDRVIAMTRFDRKREMAEYEKALGKKTDYLKKKCGFTVPTKIVWDSFTDAHLKEYSISGYCSSPINAMARLCGRDASWKKAFSSKVKTVECKRGEKIRTKMAGDAIHFETAFDAPNQDDFMFYNLMNVF